MTADRKPKIVALTGAGVSAESGIKTFRDSGGLWENHAVSDVATPEGFARNPKLVWNFYRERYRKAIEASPNPGHYALSRIEEMFGERFWLITQNVDGLHQRAGSHNVLEMHGSLHTCFCTDCLRHYPTKEILDQNPIPYCSACGAMLRPDIVWFGEIPYHLDKIEVLLQNCDIFLVIGTSGAVYPAAGFVMTTKYMGARTLGFNLEKPLNSNFFDEFVQGKTGDSLPQYVTRLEQAYCNTD